MNFNTYLIKKKIQKINKVYIYIYIRSIQAAWDKKLSTRKREIISLFKKRMALYQKNSNNYQSELQEKQRLELQTEEKIRWDPYFTA